MLFKLLRITVEDAASLIVNVSPLTVSSVISLASMTSLKSCSYSSLETGLKISNLLFSIFPMGSPVFSSTKKATTSLFILEKISLKVDPKGDPVVFTASIRTGIFSETLS